MLPLTLIRKQVASLFQRSFIYEEIVKLEARHSCPLGDREGPGAIKQVLKTQEQKGKQKVLQMGRRRSWRPPAQEQPANKISERKSEK